MLHLTLTHLCDVEGCEADSEDDQHCAQQLDSPPPPLPEEIQTIHHCDTPSASSVVMMQMSVTSCMVCSCFESFF